MILAILYAAMTIFTLIAMVREWWPFDGFRPDNLAMLIAIVLAAVGWPASWIVAIAYEIDL